jgi:hypothetical protein
MLALALLTHPSTLAAAEGKRPWPDDRAMEAAKVRAKQVVNEDVERQRREERGACGTGPKLDPFEIWKGVTGPKEAGRLLRHHYGRIHSVEAMADWLRCQGFHATVMHGPFSHIKNSDRKIAAGFILSEHGGRPLWMRLFPWPPIYSHSFGIYFDKQGELFEIEAGYTVE